MHKKGQVMNVLERIIKGAVRSTQVLSHLHPELEHRFFAYYSKNGVVKDTVAKAVSYIYDNEFTECHDICWFDRQTYFILPATMMFPKSVMVTFLKEYKSYPGLKSPEEMRQCAEDIAEVSKAVHRAILPYKKSRRKYSREDPLPDFPGFKELRKFHECSRKKVYDTQEEAATHRDEDMASYKCDYCSLWHNGHPSQLTEVSREAMEKRYKRTWRRYNNV